MMKKVIHIHQNKIRQNIKRDASEVEPPVIVRTYKGVKYYNEINIEGPCKVIYSPHKPLSCGARVWIETESKVTGEEK